MRILIIEDDIQLCEVLTFELENEGFSVDTCHNGEDGLYYILENATILFCWIRCSQL